MFTSRAMRGVPAADLRARGAHLGELPEVRVRDLHRGARRLPREALPGRVRARPAAGDEHEPVARAREPERGLLADAGRRTGHHGDRRVRGAVASVRAVLTGAVHARDDTLPGVRRTALVLLGLVLLGAGVPAGRAGVGRRCRGPCGGLPRGDACGDRAVGVSARRAGRAPARAGRGTRSQRLPVAGRRAARVRGQLLRRAGRARDDRVRAQRRGRGPRARAPRRACTDERRLQQDLQRVRPTRGVGRPRERPRAAHAHAHPARVEGDARGDLLRLGHALRPRPEGQGPQALAAGGVVRLRGPTSTTCSTRSTRCAASRCPRRPTRSCPSTRRGRSTASASSRSARARRPARSSASSTRGSCGRTRRSTGARTTSGTAA